MKKFLRYFFVVAITLATAATFTACGDDDEPKAPVTGSVLGTWVNTSVETVDNVTVTTTKTIYFSSNGTGYDQTEIIYSNGTEQNYKYSFHYTMSVETSGIMLIQLQYDDEDETINITATRTGDTLVIGNKVYQKK